MKIFIGAHLDDIEIGCGAYLSKLKEEGVLEYIDKKFLILSEGMFKNPIDLSRKRREAFEINMEKLGIKENEYKIISQRMDTEFHKHYHEIKYYLNELLKEAYDSYDDIEVYFHSADNHHDHQLVNKLVKEIFRPFFVVKLIEYEIPGSNLYNKPGDNFNQYFLFDEKIAQKKKELLESYKNISLFDVPDIRGIEMIMKHNEFYGSKFREYDEKIFAERYNIIFQKFCGI